MAIASLILGILSAMIMFVPVVGMGALLTSIIGIILGVMGKKNLAAEGKPTGMATAGTVLCVLSLIGSTFVTLLCAACLSTI